MPTGTPRNRKPAQPKPEPEVIEGEVIETAPAVIPDSAPKPQDRKPKAKKKGKKKKRTDGLDPSVDLTFEFEDETYELDRDGITSVEVWQILGKLNEDSNGSLYIPSLVEMVLTPESWAGFVAKYRKGRFTPLKAMLDIFMVMEARLDAVKNSLT